MVGLLTQALALVGGTAAGQLWPRVQQPLLRRDTWINLGNALLLYPVRLGLGWLGLFEVKWGVVPMGWLGHPVAQLLFSFVVLDFCRYWLHYAHHRIPFLWSFHRVHHSSETMDATSGLRMHLVDFVQLGLLPVLLFGLIFDTSSFAAWVLPAAMVPGVLFDALEHANLRWEPTRWRRIWHLALNNPLFHSWHHTRDGILCDGNYGNVLLFWDRLFGTDVTGDRPPELMGIDGDQRLENSLLGLQLLRREGGRS